MIRAQNQPEDPFPTPAERLEYLQAMATKLEAEGLLTDRPYSRPIDTARAMNTAARLALFAFYAEGSDLQTALPDNLVLQKLGPKIDQARCVITESYIRKVGSLARMIGAHRVSIDRIDQRELTQAGLAAITAAIIRGTKKSAVLLNEADKWERFMLSPVSGAIRDEYFFHTVSRRMSGTYRHYLRRQWRAEAELYESLGRQPTVAELAARLGWDEERVTHLRTACERPLSFDGALDTLWARADKALDSIQSGDTDDQEGNEEDQSYLIGRAFDLLKPYEKDIIEARFGLSSSPELDLHEIAARRGTGYDAARILTARTVDRLKTVLVGLQDGTLNVLEWVDRAQGRRGVQVFLALIGEPLYPKATLEELRCRAQHVIANCPKLTEAMRDTVNALYGLTDGQPLTAQELAIREQAKLSAIYARHTKAMSNLQAYLGAKKDTDNS